MNMNKIYKSKKIIFTAFLSVALLIQLMPSKFSKKAFAFKAAIKPDISIKQAFIYALKYNKMLRLEKIKLNGAGYEKNEAMSGFFPKINFDEIYMNTNNPLYAFGNVLNQRILTDRNVQSYFSPSFLNNPGMIHNYESEFSIEQPIFMGGEIYFGYKRAQLHMQSVKKGLSEAKQEVLYGVAKAYYSVILAKKYVNLMKSMLKTAENYKTLSENLFKAGQVVSSDVLRAKVEAAKMKEKLASAEKNYRLAKYFLNITIGLPISSNYVITSKLKNRPLRKTISISSMQKTAFRERPDYKALLLNKKNMALGVKSAYGKFLPKLVAGYDYFSNGPAIHPDDSYSYAFTVMLHFNIFSGLYDYNNLQKSKSSYNEMLEYRGLLRDKIKMQVRKAYLQYKTDLINTGVAKLAALNAKQTLKITTNRYKAGMTTLINLDRTLDELKAAKLNYLNTLYKLNTDKYYIKLVTGTL
ncbi:MAG: TolC family protein [Candidatus Acidulodesulfobacterium acidiphilum]|jgi:outer membrane protein TolC|uniref:TolC family protein n=1 Tax=Candidatus Acidulodesulfobacterium acidiphilum TaxID=2597224 RepID=A0A520XAI4_9DELT|nr:MAG: TolC family protein [Candidatus Acidulodesulfobacterium acidiphilum]